MAKGLRGASPLIDECRERSYDLLGHNIVEAGIFAATPVTQGGQQVHQGNYARVWARDSAWTSLYMLHSGNKSFIRAALASLESLARGQDQQNGCIPNFVSMDGTERDFWYHGVVDSTLLWLILVHEARRLGLVESDYLQRHVRKAIQWALCQEHSALRLIYQQPAADWMDSRDDRYGFVLYTNALWYSVKRRWRLANRAQTYEAFNTLFFPYKGLVSEDRRTRIMLESGFQLVHTDGGNTGRLELGLSYVNTGWSGAEDGDVLGNLLAVWTGVVNDARAEKIINGLLAEGAADPHPCKSVLWPADEDGPRQSLFYKRHEQNRPGEYQNGGAWPYIGGLAVMPLVAMNYAKPARRLRKNLAAANSLGDWRFSEQISTNDGKLLGMEGQTWNAATFLLADMAVQRMDGQPHLDPFMERL